MSEVEKPFPTKSFASKTLARLLRDWLVRLGSALSVLGLGVFSLFWSYQSQTYTYRLDLGQADSAAYREGTTA